MENFVIFGFTNIIEHLFDFVNFVFERAFDFWSRFFFFAEISIIGTKNQQRYKGVCHMKKFLLKPTRSAADPSCFGGFLYPSDFNTEYRGKINAAGSAAARRILSDRRFDKSCREMKENENRRKAW